MTHRPIFRPARTRRRRYLLQQLSVEAATSAAAAQAEELASHVIRIAPPSQDNTEAASRPQRSLPEMLVTDEPITWLFVGDSYTAPSTAPVAWRTYTSRFAGAIRTSFERPRDVFIDGTFPQSRLSEILFEFEKRIARFEPDVCFLSLSLREADAKSTDRCEKMLLRLIEWAKQSRCHLILQTPPCLPPRHDSELTRRLIFTEAVRGTAAEHELGLADHWEHWEQTALRSGDWYDCESSSPSEEGHRQIARRLLQELMLSETQAMQTAASYPPEPSR